MGSYGKCALHFIWESVFQLGYLLLCQLGSYLMAYICSWKTYIEVDSNRNKICGQMCRKQVVWLVEGPGWQGGKVLQSVRKKLEIHLLEYFDAIEIQLVKISKHK